MSREHLSEDFLNMYLDGELGIEECSHVEAHLVACAACRAELRALQRLFVALEELRTAPTPAPDLVPGVLAQVGARQMASGLGMWLVYALQGVTPLALLILAWAWLGSYWVPVLDILTSEVPGEAWTEAVAWMATQWALLCTWLGEVWTDIQRWGSHLSSLDGLGLSLSQVAIVGAALTILWLVGNAALLRRAALNGQATH